MRKTFRASLIWLEGDQLPIRNKWKWKWKLLKYFQISISSSQISMLINCLLYLPDASPRFPKTNKRARKTVQNLQRSQSNRYWHSPARRAVLGLEIDENQFSSYQHDLPQHSRRMHFRVCAMRGRIGNYQQTYQVIKFFGFFSSGNWTEEKIEREIWD